MPSGNAGAEPDPGPGVHHNTSMVMSVALRHRASGAGCAARRNFASLFTALCRKKYRLHYPNEDTRTCFARSSGSLARRVPL